MISSDPVYELAEVFRIKWARARSALVLCGWDMQAAAQHLGAELCEHWDSDGGITLEDEDDDEPRQLEGNAAGTQHAHEVLRRVCASPAMFARCSAEDPVVVDDRLACTPFCVFLSLLRVSIHIACHIC
jgi:hypothetical protein